MQRAMVVNKCAHHADVYARRLELHLDKCYLQ